MLGHSRRHHDHISGEQTWQTVPYLIDVNDLLRLSLVDRSDRCQLDGYKFDDFLVDVNTVSAKYVYGVVWDIAHRMDTSIRNISHEVSGYNYVSYVSRDFAGF